jgi:hypothetical protein
MECPVCHRTLHVSFDQLTLHVNTHFDQPTDGPITTLARHLALIGSTFKLCHPSLELAHTVRGVDRGWGCGYRNITMLTSVLRVMYPERLVALPSDVSILWIQSQIERGWQLGFDTVGGAQLAYRLRGKNKWIGATEVLVFLASIGFRSVVVDVERTTPITRLVEYITEHFTRETQMPLYLQHQGHSRTVVGIEWTRTGELYLMVADPAHIVSANMGHNEYVRAFRVSERDLARHDQYQLVLVREEPVSSRDKVIHAIKL